MRAPTGACAGSFRAPAGPHGNRIRRHVITAIVLLAALALDTALGEPRRGHPLVAFGALASQLERWANCAQWSASGRRLAGIAALVTLVLPLSMAGMWLAAWPGGWAVELAVLYLALGMRSLSDHAERVAHALAAGDLPAARAALGTMVSRDTADLDERRVAAGATESVLENGTDAVFGTLFWFLVAGAPGVIAYRLVNTLDAMWGYRTPRFTAFGWAAARLDDVLNWLPARLTVLTYALVGVLPGVIRDGRPLAAWRCAWRQGGRTDSPNAGLVMAAGAGVLGVRLGGPGRYHGRIRWRPRFGYGGGPDAATLRQSIRLVQGGAVLWLLVVLVAAVAMEWWVC